MKKLLGILVIAGAMTACNNSTETTTTIDSTVKAVADTVKTAVDSAVHKIDSSAKAVVDTAKAKIGAAADSAKKAVKK